MATKLKNLRMTSVDLVRNGANQAADICLYKSADPTDDPTMPTAEETNVLKRFFARLFATPAEAAVEPDDPIEKADEESYLADVYKSAITESLQSIAADETLSATEKNDMIAKSLSEYHDAMLDLFGFGPEEEPLQKSDDDDDLDDWEWDEEEEEEVEDVEKFNENHDALGRFAPAGGGGGASGASGGRFSAKDFQGSEAVAGAANKLDKEMTDRGFSGIERHSNGAYGQAVVYSTGGDAVGIETADDGKFSCYRWQGAAYKTEKYLMDKWEGKKVPDYRDQVGKSADFDEIEEV